MRKVLKIILTILLAFNFTNTYASTTTYERTDDNLRVPSKVSDPDSKKDYIMSTPSVDASEKIYDFADLYTDSEEQELYNKVQSFISNYNMDFAIVTINDNPKTDETEYADDFYDYNDFKTDGVLFLIDMDNRQLHMTTTGSAIRMYNDARIDAALDSVYTYMSDENYFTGTSNYIEKISDYAKSGPPKSANSIYGKPSFKEALFTSIPISLITSLVITLIIMIILVMKNKLVRKATTASEYLNKEKTNIQNIGDRFISSNTVRHRIETSSSSSGGSSTHSGSSGISHGGGSHGF